MKGRQCHRWTSPFESLQGIGHPHLLQYKDFTGRPLDELKFVIHANLTRRHLDEFQKAEIAIKFDKLFRKIAREKFRESHFNSESGREAGVKSGASRQPRQQEEETDEADERLASEGSRRSPW